MTESHKRTLARTISYRITALLITAIWTGLGDAVIIHIILKMVLNQNQMCQKQQAPVQVPKKD